MIHYIRRLTITVTATVVAVFARSASQAQQRTLSLKEVLQLVETGQPRLKALKGQVAASNDNIALARNSIMPNLTASYQAVYATDNNSTGMFYPGLLMPISGPVNPHSSNNLLPGTALTAFLQWTPLTFGQRAAAVEKASAQFRLAAKTYDNTLFRQRYASILTYLNIVYLYHVLNTQQSNIDRTANALQQSLILAKQGLRAGLDTIQFQSLLAQAVIEKLTTQKLYTAAILDLCKLTGLQNHPEELSFTDTLLTKRLPALTDTSDAYTQNPDYQYSQAQLAFSKASLKEIERGWRPKLEIWANGYTRGSGISTNGTINQSGGWQLSRTNIGTGVQLSLPILQFSRVSIQKRQSRNLQQADQAQLDQIDADLKRQYETASSNYRQDILIARQAPILARAALLSYQGLELSYRSGLTDFTRLTQGQYQLVNAEMNETAANLQVWRSLLEVGVVKGDLDLFTSQLK